MATKQILALYAAYILTNFDFHLMTLKTSRKRASLGNTAPAPKRRVIEKNTRENGINRVQEERRLHRKRPVTISKQDIEESSSSDDESSQEDVLNNDTENDLTEGVNTLEDLEGTWKEGHDTKTKTTTSGQCNSACYHTFCIRIN